MSEECVPPETDLKSRYDKPLSIRFLIGLFVALLVVLDVVILACPNVSLTPNGAIDYLVLAYYWAQLNLLALWCAVGPGRFPWRFAGATVAWLALVSSWFWRPNLSPLISNDLLWVAAVPALLTFGVAAGLGYFGFHLSAVKRDETEQRLRKWQFSLADVAILITILALALVWFRSLLPNVEAPDAPKELVVGCVSMVAVFLLVCLSIVASRWILKVAFALASASITLAWFLLFSVPHPGIVFLLEIVLTALLLLGVRLCGYRLEFKNRRAAAESLV